jgi:alanine racemase
LSEREATAILTVDLAALVSNYRQLAELSAPAECAAVVKADGYGLGAAETATALWAAGCRNFFVATLAEARALRDVLPEAVIYLLNGLLPGTAASVRDCGVRPVLNSAEEISDWATLCRESGAKLPAAVHIDSGMNRLGLSPEEAAALGAQAELWNAFELALVMSHLACADEPGNPKNEMQRQSFEALRRLLPNAPASLANSAGILLGKDYHFDLVRPGIALYGSSPRGERNNPFAPVLRLEGRVLQIRNVPKGETFGYGARRTAQRPSRVATIAAGYADGLFRALGSSDDDDGLTAYVDGKPAPVLGRVSMDLITVDITDLPEDAVARGTLVELIGPNAKIDLVAEHAGTLGYEILTHLGPRYQRRYIGG